MDRDNPTKSGRARRHLDIEILLAGAGTLGARLRHASGAVAVRAGCDRHHRHGSRHRYLREVCMAAFNAESACPPPEEG